MLCAFLLYRSSKIRFQVNSHSTVRLHFPLFSEFLIQIVAAAGNAFFFKTGRHYAVDVYKSQATRQALVLLHTQIVPDVHLSAQRSDLDDGLTQEVVRLPLELLLHARLDVVVLVPHAHLDAVRRVVALAA